MLGVTLGGAGAAERVSVTISTLAPGPYASLAAKVAGLMKIALQDYEWIRISGEEDVRDERAPAAARITLQIMGDESKHPARLVNVRATWAVNDGAAPPVAPFFKLFPESELFGNVQALSREIADALRRRVMPERRDRALRIALVCLKGQGAGPRAFLQSILIQEIAAGLRSGPFARDLLVEQPVTDPASCGVPTTNPNADVVITGSFDLVESSADSRLTISTDVLAASDGKRLGSAEASGAAPAFAEIARDLGGRLAVDLAPVVARIRDTGDLIAMPVRPQIPVSALLVEAKRAADAGDVAQAIALYREAGWRNPALTEPRLRLAEILRQRRDWEGVVTELTSALQATPDLTEASEMLGGALEELGRIQEASQVYTRALRVAKPPQRYPLVRALARAYQQLGRDDDAIALLEASTNTASPPQAELWQLLGRAQRSRREYDKAIDSLHLATAADAVHREELLATYLDYAQSLRARKDDSLLLVLFRSQKYRDELNAFPPGVLKGRLLFLEGWAFFTTNAPEEAVGRLEKSREAFRAPGSTVSGEALFDAYLLLARAHLMLAATKDRDDNLKRAKQAAEAAQAQYRDSPTGPEVLGQIAETQQDPRGAADHYAAAARQHEQIKNSEDAVRFYEKSLALDLQVTERGQEWRWTRLVYLYEGLCALQQQATLDKLRAWLDGTQQTEETRLDRDFAWAYALHHAERFGEAAAAYELLLRNAPNNVSALVNLGYAYGSLGRRDDAIKQFNRAQALGLSRFGFFVTMVGLGTTSLPRDPATALSHFQKAAEYQPSHFEPHVRMGQAHLALKHTKDAITSYQQAVALLGRRTIKACDPDIKTVFDLDVGLAEAYVSENQPDEAGNHLKRVTGYYANKGVWKDKLAEELRRFSARPSPQR
jgi:tetratricopeptide (TPR) repeat protein